MAKWEKSQARTISLVMALTLIGKVMGLLRDRLLTINYGAGMETNAFLTASRIPRVFFDAVFAAAIAACFIPVFSEYLTKKGKKEAFAFGGNFITVMGLLTLVLTGLGMAFAQPLVTLFADGYDAETAALCVSLTRVMFPTVFFTGIAFSFVGVLQSMEEFNIPAIISVVSNGVIILYYYTGNAAFGIYGLAVAFLIGWFLQAVVQVPSLVRRGYRYQPDFRVRNEGMKKVLALMGPVMISTWVQPINLTINSKFGSRLYDGSGVTAIELSNNLYLIFAGVFVLSITNVIFPQLSRLTAQEDDKGFRDVIQTTMHTCLFFVFPMMAGLMVLARPVIDFIYGGGAFDAFSVDITANALFFVSLGMVAYAVQNILSRAYFARQNGRAPLFAGLLSIAVNIILCMVLVGSYSVSGLAVASSAASVVNAVVLMVPMERQGRGFLSAPFLKDMGKIVLATCVMSAAAYGTLRAVTGLLPGDPGKLLCLCAPALAGAVVYFLVVWLFGLPEVRLTLEKFSRRMKH